MTSKVVLITGASSGIGLATAELLHEQVLLFMVRVDVQLMHLNINSI
jgi:NAD(P)-dependent dehydrogenase (short-subunit alcohol dehydrogenase family)